MKIHSTSKFDNKENSFHTEFEVNATIQQISANTEKIVNLAIQHLKKKCDEYFKIEFGTLVFLEVYFFYESKEVIIFKKEKV